MNLNVKKVTVKLAPKYELQITSKDDLPRRTLFAMLYLSKYQPLSTHHRWKKKYDKIRHDTRVTIYSSFYLLTIGLAYFIFLPWQKIYIFVFKNQNWSKTIHVNDTRLDFLSAECRKKDDLPRILSEMIQKPGTRC